MIKQNINKFSSQKHNKLLRIATFSNVFAWIVLCTYLIGIAADFYHVMHKSIKDIEMLYGEIYSHILITTMSDLILLVKGIIFWLILKGIAMGLIMIVETDINYRDFQKDDPRPQKIELSDEEDKPAIFYNPKFVINLETWLSNAAVISIYISILTNILTIGSLNAVVTSFFPGRTDLSGIAWIITILLTLLSITLQSSIYFFSLNSLRTILMIIMEIEFNSRFVIK